MPFGGRRNGCNSSGFVTDTFAEYRRWLLRHAGLDRIAYTAEGKTWIVISGPEGPNVVYQKTVEGCGAAHEVRIAYPAAKRAVYDPVVARIARSLTCVSAPAPRR